MLWVLIVQQQVNAFQIHAVASLSQLMYVVLLAVHIFQHQMENIFNSCLHLIGHPFKLKIIASIKLQLIAFQVPIQLLIILIQEWDYFSILPIVHNL